MAVMAPGKGKGPGPSASITFGQKIGMRAKSSRRGRVLKRTTPHQTRREPSISEPMTIGMVRQQAEACLTLAGRLGSRGIATPPVSGID
jgi:hypothetical protein